LKVRFSSLNPGDRFRFEGLNYIKAIYPNANAICPSVQKFAEIPGQMWVSVPPFGMADDEEEGMDAKDAIKEMNLSKTDYERFLD